MQETSSNGFSKFFTAGDVGVTCPVGVEGLDDMGIGTLIGSAGVSTGEGDLEIVLVRSTDTVRSPSLLVRSTDTVSSRVGCSEPERSWAALNVVTLSG